MGYCTIYNASVSRVDNQELSKAEHTLICKKLQEINPNYFEDVTLEYYGDYPTLSDVIGYDSMKWYDHDEDMVELSKSFPDYIFELVGWGEDVGDWWTAKYHNGKYKLKTVELPKIGLDELE